MITFFAFFHFQAARQAESQARVRAAELRRQLEEVESAEARANAAAAKAAARALASTQELGLAFNESEEEDSEDGDDNEEEVDRNEDQYQELGEDQSNHGASIGAPIEGQHQGGEEDGISSPEWSSKYASIELEPAVESLGTVVEMYDDDDVNDSIGAPQGRVSTHNDLVPSPAAASSTAATAADAEVDSTPVHTDKRAPRFSLMSSGVSSDGDSSYGDSNENNTKMATSDKSNSNGSSRSALRLGRRRSNESISGAMTTDDDASPTQADSVEDVGPLSHFRLHEEPGAAATRAGTSASPSHRQKQCESDSDSDVEVLSLPEHKRTSRTKLSAQFSANSTSDKNNGNAYPGQNSNSNSSSRSSSTASLFPPAFVAAPALVRASSTSAPNVTATTTTTTLVFSSSSSRTIGASYGLVDDDDSDDDSDNDGIFTSAEQPQQQQPKKKRGSVLAMAPSIRPAVANHNNQSALQAISSEAPSRGAEASFGRDALVAFVASAGDRGTTLDEVCAKWPPAQATTEVNGARQRAVRKLLLELTSDFTLYEAGGSFRVL